MQAENALVQANLSKSGETSRRNLKSNIENLMKHHEDYEKINPDSPKKENVVVNRFVMSEENPYKRVWDSYIIALIFYIATIVPFRLAFKS